MQSSEGINEFILWVTKNIYVRSYIFILLRDNYKPNPIKIFMNINYV